MLADRLGGLLEPEPQEILTAAEAMDGEMFEGFVSKNPAPGPLYSEIWWREDAALDYWAEDWFGDC